MRTYWLDVLVALLAAAAVVELVVTQDAREAPSTTLWLLIPAVAILTLPILVRRRSPFAAAAAFWLLAVAFSFVDGRLFASIESLFLLGVAISFLLGNLPDPVQARVGLAVVVVSAGLVVYNIPEHATAEVIFVPLVFGSCWLAGYALRERAERVEAAEMRAAQAEREREAAARVAAAEERARIARELHDVVAHAVSVMVLQIGAVRHKLSPETLDEDRDALRHVEQAGRTALAEMRRLLGAMRPDGDGLALGPQPGLDRLESLIEDVDRAGLLVRLHVEGEAFTLPRAIDLSAYRIVQEGLTNALKHAHARHADVTLRYRPDELELRVLDDGTGTATTDGLGHGLIGIRERVKIYGGEMTAGARPAGGFMLTARLPIDHQP